MCKFWCSWESLCLVNRFNFLKYGQYLDAHSSDQKKGKGKKKMKYSAYNFRSHGKLRNTLKIKECVLTNY